MDGKLVHERFHYYQPLGKCKLKLCHDETHLLKWLKLKVLAMPSASKFVEQTSHALLVNMQNGTATLESNLAFL